MSKNDDNSEVTQGENPGAQGDFGAGQGEPGLVDPLTGDPVLDQGRVSPSQDDLLDADHAANN